MDKHKRRLVFLVVLGMFLIGGVMMGRYVLERGYYEAPGTLSEIGLGDMCLLAWLPMIERAIESYQREFEGENPDDLEILVEQYGLGQMTCEYVYRGADLTAEAPVGLIVVYDKAGNHSGYRNVLWAREAVEFLVDETEVNREEYLSVCASVLMSRDMAELDIRLDDDDCLQVDEDGRYLVYGRQVAVEEYREVFNQLVLEYKSGLVAEERLGIWVKNVENDWWERKAWVRRHRQVQQVDEEVFVRLIERDNEIRRELGLAEKENDK